MINSADTLLFFDTETTGIPEWSTPSDDPCQPHIVEIAAELVDKESQETIKSMDLLIRPDGWTIPEDVAEETHGITTEMALEQGVVTETEALDQFLDEFWPLCSTRVAFNEPFDARIIRIAMKRFRPARMDLWRHFSRECVMRMGRTYCPGRHRLQDCHVAIIGGPMPGKPHRAASDTAATRAVYFEILKLQGMSAPELLEWQEARDAKAAATSAPTETS